MATDRQWTHGAQCAGFQGAFIAVIYPCRKCTALHHLSRRLMPSLVYQALRRYAKPVPSAFPHGAAGLGLTDNGHYPDPGLCRCLFAIGFAQVDAWWMVVGGCRGLGGERGLSGSGITYVIPQLSPFFLSNADRGLCTIAPSNFLHQAEGANMWAQGVADTSRV